MFYESGCRLSLDLVIFIPSSWSLYLGLCGFVIFVALQRDFIGGLWPFYGQVVGDFICTFGTLSFSTARGLKEI